MWLRNLLTILVWGGLFFGVLLGIGAWMIHGSTQVFLARPTVPGRVLEMSVEMGYSKSRYWRVKTRYAYEVEGQSYVGETLSNETPRELLLWNPQPSPALTRYVERYPVGSTVTVRYSPKDPRRSLLEVNPDAARGPALAAGVALLVAVLGLVGHRFVR
ncbi:MULTISPECIES: DUF3592 domain-containing protein [unclassified Corallococcus]|uniref:DUF3592 domain-containing protein n=1 Tax=unclassified Corallococcus TaxID=2685029 RepID=UPI001A8BFC89|nr:MULTISPECIES: DUF3592 domain-containing protein [unclassified Corallococcus]MBN9684722.1 DUF3592 domain-containing protein [Corallococcus sp. NCSPR001]WAS83808.1 DUF3592 domain-containing protein [Corallococcus sp. NCRR]